jgi:hypothetical protein
MKLKGTKHVGFNENPEIIADIDAAAKSEGLDRSGWVRQTIRMKLRGAADTK